MRLRNYSLRGGLCCARAGALLGTGAMLAAMVGPVAAGAAPGRAPVRRVLQGSAAFRDTWSGMQARDRVIGALGAPVAAPSVRVAKPGHPLASVASIRAGAPVRPAAAAGPLTLLTGFAGLSSADQDTAFGSHSFPPSIACALGPLHVVEALNGSVAVFTRAGAALSHVSLSAFFATPPLYPRGYAQNPRVVYDRESERWFASALEFNGGFANDLILAVSATSDPTGAWDKYHIAVGELGATTSSHTLAVDTNGVYFGMSILASGSASGKIAATRKEPLVASPASLGTVSTWTALSDMWGPPCAAQNTAAVGAGGYAWFVASSTDSNANVRYRVLEWTDPSTPVLSDVAEAASPDYALPMLASALGSPSGVDTGDDRVQCAVVRANHLWLTRTVGANSLGGSDTADRTACEWIDLDVTGAPVAVLGQSGRVVDADAADPLSVYYPALAVNGQGNVAMNFSGSRASTYIGAYAAYWPSTTPGGPTSMRVLHAGTAAYSQLDGQGLNRWGDYSAAVIDPQDDMTAWCATEYAAAPASTWGTRISPIMAPAPTLDTPAIIPDAPPGLTDISVTYSGSGLFDPGAGFAGRLQASISGDGIENLTWTYTPASIALTFDVAAAATKGLRDITVTNPDGQSVTLTSGLAVGLIASKMLTAVRVGWIGQGIDLVTYLKRTGDNTPVAGRTVRFTVDGADAGAGVTGADGMAVSHYIIPHASGPGSRTILAAFDGDNVFKPSSSSATLTVAKGNTVISHYASAGAVGVTIPLSALLISGSVRVVGRTLAFAVEGVPVGTGVTDANGKATVMYTIPGTLGGGPHNVTATFDGTLDLEYNGSTRTSATLTVGKTATRHSPYAASGMPGATVTLRSILLSGALLVVGRTVSFEVDGVPVGSGVTNASGVASCSWTIPLLMTAGAHNLTTTFDGTSDPAYLSSSRTSAVITVSKQATSISLYVASGVRGATVSLRCLLYSKGLPVAGKTIAFSVDGALVGSGVTDAAGQATVSYTIPADATVGLHNVTGAFDGTLDPVYASSTRTTAVLTVK